MSSKLIRILFSFVCLILMTCYSGCSLISPIIGNWADSNEQNIFEFTRDGNVIINSHGYLITGKYELIGNDVVKLNLEGLSGGIAGAFGIDTWQYKISGDTMTVQSGGKDSVYHRVQSRNITSSTAPSKLATSEAIVSPKPSSPVIISTKPLPLKSNTSTAPTKTTISSSTLANIPPKPSPTIKSTTLAPVTPVVSSVSKISVDKTQTITVNGQGFGSLQPYNGNSKYIEITNLTWGWRAGYNNNGVTLNITQWTDNQIQISGFTGKYGDFILHVGDNLQIKVWNAPSGLGPSTYSAVCGAPPNSVLATPVITSVSDIFATQIQNIIISGTGFGTLDPYNGSSPFIQIMNKTSGWSAGYNVGTSQGPNGVTLNITQWTDNQIQISGFTGKYGDFTLHEGDDLLFKVWSVPSGKGPVSYSLVCLGN